jgi:hypothetical protein
MVAHIGVRLWRRALATTKQFVKVETGEGVLTTISHTYGIVEHYDRARDAGGAHSVEFQYVHVQSVLQV